MTGTEQQALEIIWDQGGETSVDVIARNLKVSKDYARLICYDLGSKDCVDIYRTGWLKLRGKGKLEVAKRKVDKSTEEEQRLKEAVSVEPPRKRGVIINY